MHQTIPRYVLKIYALTLFIFGTASPTTVPSSLGAPPPSRSDEPDSSVANTDGYIYRHKSETRGAGKNLIRCSLESPWINDFLTGILGPEEPSDNDDRMVPAQRIDYQYHDVPSGFHVVIEGNIFSGANRDFLKAILKGQMIDVSDLEIQETNVRMKDGKWLRSRFWRLRAWEMSDPAPPRLGLPIINLVVALPRPMIDLSGHPSPTASHQ